MEINSYLNRRKGYAKLESSGCRRRKTSHLEAAAEAQAPNTQQKRRSRKTMKLDKVVKFCGGLRDAYVDFMMRNADARVIGDGMGDGYGGAADDGFGVGGMRGLKEYDEKMIMEMYKSVVIVGNVGLSSL